MIPLSRENGSSFFVLSMNLKIRIYKGNPDQ